MTNIQSLPVQQQPQRRSTLKINGNNFYAHFGCRRNLNRMFLWSNTLRKIHAGILMVSFHLFWLPLVNEDSCGLIRSSLTESNNSLRTNDLSEEINMKRCALSSAICAGTVTTYMHMRILVAFISFGSYILIPLMVPLCKEISYDQLVDPSQWFRWCYKILIHLVISSICHQLASILICRPIDILYDIRFLSMFIVQIIGFFICLLFAFFLGVKYASVRRGN